MSYRDTDDHGRPLSLSGAYALRARACFVAGYTRGLYRYSPVELLMCPLNGPTHRP